MRENVGGGERHALWLKAVRCWRERFVAAGVVIGEGPLGAEEVASYGAGGVRFVSEQGSCLVAAGVYSVMKRKVRTLFLGRLCSLFCGRAGKRLAAESRGML